MIIKNKNSKLKKIIASGLIVVALASTWVWIDSRNSVSDEEGQSSAVESENTAQKDGAEQKEAEEKKDTIVKEESSNTNTQPSNNSKKDVTPVITSADSNRVFGYVPGVVESKGTCSFTFTGNETIVKKVKGIEDVSTTNCSTTTPSGSGWSVVLSYSSNSVSGKSQKVSVN